MRNRMPVEERDDAMANKVGIYAATSNDVLVRSSRDVDVAVTEVLVSLLESAIWARFKRAA